MLDLIQGMIQWLVEPLGYSFMVRGLMAAIMVGTICAVLGTYVILQGMAFFGDALAHTILPGVVLAYLVGWPLAVGALIFGVLSAVGIGALSQRGEVREDTAIGQGLGLNGPVRRSGKVPRGSKEIGSLR